MNKIGWVVQKIQQSKVVALLQGRFCAAWLKQRCIYHLWLKCCFTSTETVVYERQEPRTSTSTFTQLLSSVVLHCWVFFFFTWCLMSSDVGWHIRDNAWAWFNITLRPWKPYGSLGRAAPDGHLDSHTAPELCTAGFHLFVRSVFV